MSDLRTLISDIAIEHQIDDDHPNGGWICTCGREYLIDNPATFQSWDEHLADAVIAELNARMLRILLTSTTQPAPAACHCGKPVDDWGVCTTHLAELGVEPGNKEPQCECGHPHSIHSYATGTCLSGYDDFFCACNKYREAEK